MESYQKVNVVANELVEKYDASLLETNQKSSQIQESIASQKSETEEDNVQIGQLNQETVQNLTVSSPDLPKSDPVPSAPRKSTSERIERLTNIRVGGGIWKNWDSDMEKDGPVLDIVYYDSNGKNISTRETTQIPISVDLKIYTTNREDYPYTKGRLVFSAHFLDSQLLKSSIYPEVRIPKEEINVNPSIDYEYGYVELTVHTQSQGDFSDESDFIVLYDD